MKRKTDDECDKIEVLFSFLKNKNWAFYVIRNDYF